MSVSQSVNKLFSILIVDDEPDLLELMVELMADLGCLVRAASSGNLALQKFKEGNFDLVITDIRMPDGDGIELLSNIKMISPYTPVICVTGYSQYTGINIIDMGAHAVFEKPFKIEMIQSVVNELFLNRGIKLPSHQLG